MKLYKPIFKDRQGGEVPAAKWCLDFFDHGKIRRRIPATGDKKASEAFGRNVEQLVNCRQSGLDHDVKLNQWIEGLPDDLLQKFVSWGLIEGGRAEITKPLTVHIADYVKILESKGYSQHYIVQVKNILITVITDCRFVYFRDITKSAVEMYLGKLKKDGYSGATRGHYLGAIKALLNWALDDQRIVSNPIAKTEKPSRDSKRKGVLTPEQFISLIKTTYEKNIIIHDRRRGTTTGQERAALYLVSGCTGLRKKELLNIVWGDIHLGDGAYVNVRGVVAKNDKEARQPLPTIAISLLESLRGHTKPEPTDRIFAMLSKWVNTAALIRADLQAIGIPLIDREGNEICFHSLRNSYISFLANSSTPPKVVQQLARHSDPRLTFNTYCRVFEGAEQKAIESLPNFGSFLVASAIDTTIDKTYELIGTKPDTSEHQNRDNTLKTALLANPSMRPAGLEPATLRFEASYSIQLSYGRKSTCKAIKSLPAIPCFCKNTLSCPLSFPRRRESSLSVSISLILTDY